MKPARSKDVGGPWSRGSLSHQGGSARRVESSGPDTSPVEASTNRRTRFARAASSRRNVAETDTS